MEEFLTITEFIRKELLKDYNKLKQQFFDNSSAEEEQEDLEFVEANEDENFDDLIEDEYMDEDDIDEFIDEQEDDFEEQVLDKIMEKIKVNEYKNIIYLIMLQDVYEFIKSKQVSELKLYSYENEMIEFLEIWDINNLFKKIETSYDFYLDLVTLYFEYHFENDIQNRIKNRKLIELSNNQKELEKFKIYNIDNLQYQYTKRRL